MHKVVINTCHGMFKLSIEAVTWLQENCKDQYLCKYIEACTKKHIVYEPNKAPAVRRESLCMDVSSWFDHKRHHRDLVSVVEALGDKASGSYSHLTIVTITSNQYRIEEYDGAEKIITPEDTEEWIVID